MKQIVFFLLSVLGVCSASAVASQGTADLPVISSLPPVPATTAPVKNTQVDESSMPAAVTADNSAQSAQTLLESMAVASQNLNYELSFIRVSKSSVDSMRYRHAYINKRNLSQMLYLDGPRREVLQRGDEVSYFESGVEPFTIRSSHIVDSLPSVLHGDFKQLSKFYDFVPVGRARVVDRPTQVVRIVPRDDFRYSYVVWLDEENKLLLRADLLDRDGETLEQYRVISYVVTPELMKVMSKLDDVSLPPVLAFEPQAKQDLAWKLTWLPNGFAEVSRSRHRLPNVDIPVESRLYSDGLFSFTVYVSPTDGRALHEQLVRQGRRTVHIENQGPYEITVVGELPPSTTKRIVHGVKFDAAPASSAPINNSGSK